MAPNAQDRQDRLHQLPPLRDIIKEHGLQADKKFGQNFLLDLNITAKIARLAGNCESHHLIEIGPGPGGLTRALLSMPCQSVTVVEHDPRFVPVLESLAETAAPLPLHIFQGDALETDLLAHTSTPRKLVANLPYNVATPLLIGWLEQIFQAVKTQKPMPYDRMVLMFQHEVAQRITAQPHSKAYGRLSLLAQLLCDCQIGMTLPPEAFTPPPKISSSVVVLTTKNEVGADLPPLDAFNRVTHHAFTQRRKMLRQALKPLWGDKTSEKISSAGIDPTARAEALTADDFVKLARKV